MAEVTLKSTKAEIMEAYKAAKAKLDAQAQLTDDPVKAAMVEKRTATLASADDIATQDILNPNIIAKYNDLKEAIDIKKAELKICTIWIQKLILLLQWSTLIRRKRLS